MSTTIDQRSRVQDGRRLLWAAASAIVALLFASTRPVTHWEMDELLFRMGVERFEPLLHHPHPPGYPLLIGLGKLATLVTGDPFHGLVLLAIVSITISFVVFGLAVERLTGHTLTGLAATVLFHLSPAMLVHGPMPMSDPPALMFASLAIYAASFTGPGVLAAIATGACAAASIGCRPQYALAIVPMIAWVALRDRRVDRGFALLAAFTAVCLAWLVPLAIHTGGPGGLLAWQQAQADWVAQNDATLARRSHSVTALVFRFTAHPWGSKLTSAPVLLFATAGFVLAATRRMTALVPIAVLSVAHLVSGLALYDPADGVRYSLPAHYLTATLCAIALAWLAAALRPQAVVVFLMVFIVGSWLYVRPFVMLRSSEPSPPAQAANWARTHLESNALVLYDRSLMPHAQVLFARFDVRSSDNGVGAGERPVYLFGEGANAWGDPVTFSWPHSDAYGKLTRNHYRVVSLTPVVAPPIALDGVGPWESADGGARWRWLSEDARLDIPEGNPASTLTLGLPADAPYPDTEASVYADDALLHAGPVRRGTMDRIPLRVPAGRFTLRLVSSRHYGVGDSRRFAVQLFDFDRDPEEIPPLDRVRRQTTRQQRPELGTRVRPPGAPFGTGRSMRRPGSRPFRNGPAIARRHPAGRFFSPHRPHRQMVGLAWLNDDPMRQPAEPWHVGVATADDRDTWTRRARFETDTAIAPVPARHSTGASGTRNAE